MCPVLERWKAVHTLLWNHFYSKNNFSQLHGLAVTACSCVTGRAHLGTAGYVLHTCSEQITWRQSALMSCISVFVHQGEIKSSFTELTDDSTSFWLWFPAWGRAHHLWMPRPARDVLTVSLPGWPRHAEQYCSAEIISRQLWGEDTVVIQTLRESMVDLQKHSSTVSSCWKLKSRFLLLSFP